MGSMYFFGQINFDYAVSSYESKMGRKINLFYLKIQFDLEVDSIDIY